MDPKQVRELYAATPFTPFEMVLTNGATIHVGHPEFMMFSDDYRTVHAVDERDGATKRVDVKMIIALHELKKNGSARRKPKRRK